MEAILNELSQIDGPSLLRNIVWSCHAGDLNASISAKVL